MRLPNQYGSVFKLSGKRRKPWAVRITVAWEINEGKLKRKYAYIGYYATRQEALQGLAEYNSNPIGFSQNVTFAEVYEKWSNRKFEDISHSNINGYKAAYNLCSSLYNMKFSEIKLYHLQNIADSCSKSYPTLKKLKTLLNQMFDYAVQNELITKDKHIVEYINIGKPTKSTKHYRFTSEEIEKLWLFSKNNEYVQVILMLIYSGVRPGELFALEKQNVDLQEETFYVEKGKTENAARKVPIHKKTLPFFRYWYNKNNSPYLITQLNGNRINFTTAHRQYIESYWKPVLQEMGIYEYYIDGEKKEHSPDDTRHTFTTMWKEKKLDESMRRKIQGHSGKGVGEIVYTHFDIEKLKSELNLL